MTKATAFLREANNDPSASACSADRDKTIVAVWHGHQVLDSSTKSPTDKLLPKMMIACRVSAFGPPSAIAFEQISVPTPGEGEALVRVHAAGVGPWMLDRSGKSALPQPLPLTLGCDLAGVVELVGPGVDSFKPGDPVFGVTSPHFNGAYAEYTIASAAMIARKPSDLDFLRRSLRTRVAVTAWQALFEEAKLAKGQSVLNPWRGWHVGAYAIQLAREAGLKVVATVGPNDVTLPRRSALIRSSISSDRVRDGRRARRCGSRPGRRRNQCRSFRVVKPGGALISAVSKPDQHLAAQTGVSARFFLVEVTTKGLESPGSALRKRKLTTNVGAVLPLASVRIADEMLEGKGQYPRGKIVLMVVG